MFDASFRGGARQGMRRGFSVSMSAVVRVEGSVEDPGDGLQPRDRDRRWTGEWRIPMAEVALETGGRWPPDPHKPWRFNVFRVGKDRVDGRLVLDESAFSAPAQGDFHNLERMGDLWFGAPEEKP